MNRIKVNLASPRREITVIGRKSNCFLAIRVGKISRRGIRIVRARMRVSHIYIRACALHVTRRPVKIIKSKQLELSHRAGRSYKDVK